MSNNDLRCAHCNQKVAANSKPDVETGQHFCCDGCRAVYHLISNGGLSSFYTKRTADDYTPFEDIEVSADSFIEHLKVNNDGDIELIVAISGIRCAACVYLIENYLLKQKKVKSMRINYANHKAKITFNDKDISLQEVLDSITSLGYCPLPITNVDSQLTKERRDYFYRFIVGAFFTMQLMVYSIALYAGYFQGMDESIKNLFQFIGWALATPVVFYAGYPFYSRAFKGLKHMHFTMDTLATMGAGSAYFYSIFAIFMGQETYFDTSCMIITLILLGKFIEAGVKEKSGDVVAKLLSLKPTKVNKIEMDSNGNVVNSTVIPITDLAVGDYFEVSEGVNIAADGRVFSGEAEIDEAMLTGESVPVLKSVGSEVFSGSTISRGKIIIRAENVGNKTFLSQIATTVSDAQSSRAPIQDVADKFIAYFVPFVILVAIITFIYWNFVVDLMLPNALMRAISVLVIACPCAMGLATPLAIITSAKKLSESGLLFKNGDAIERLARANDYYFDKTGTISQGIMSVVDYKIFSSDIDKALKLLCVTASYSRHPASRAISLITDNYNHTASEYEDIAGMGICANINDDTVLIGSKKYLVEQGVTGLDNSEIEQYISKWNSNGYTIVYSSINGVFVGIFGIYDEVRHDASSVISTLQKHGNNVTILTGDNRNSAEIMIANASINAKVYSEVSPFDKSEIIKDSKDINKTVMIGDGINDAIALTSASVGISMRTGTDISLESSSIILLRNDLSLILKAKYICRKTLKIIKENLFWAFSYNFIAIPLAVTGIIHPVMSAGFMAVSSLLVVTNSMRIKRLK